MSMHAHSPNATTRDIRLKILQSIIALAVRKTSTWRRIPVTDNSRDKLTKLLDRKQKFSTNVLGNKVYFCKKKEISLKLS